MSEKLTKPLLFSAPMVRALLDGSKTQTRRILKSQPALIGPNWVFNFPNMGFGVDFIDAADLSPHPVGSFIWVKETFSACLGTCFRATGHSEPCRLHFGAVPKHDWTPSIFMPKWASRITLEVLSVRVERLNEISEADAKMEGCQPSAPARAAVRLPYRNAYRILWETINGKGSWALNPWVWIYEFRRVKS